MNFGLKEPSSTITIARQGIFFYQGVDSDLRKLLRTWAPRGPCDGRELVQARCKLEQTLFFYMCGASRPRAWKRSGVFNISKYCGSCFVHILTLINFPLHTSFVGSTKGSEENFGFEQTFVYHHNSTTTQSNFLIKGVDSDVR